MEKGKERKGKEGREEGRILVIILIMDKYVSRKYVNQGKKIQK